MSLHIVFFFLGRLYVETYKNTNNEYILWEWWDSNPLSGQAFVLQTNDTLQRTRTPLFNHNKNLSNYWVKFHLSFLIYLCLIIRHVPIYGN